MIRVYKRLGPVGVSAPVGAAVGIGFLALMVDFAIFSVLVCVAAIPAAFGTCCYLASAAAYFPARDLSRELIEAGNAGWRGAAGVMEWSSGIL